MRNSFFGIAVFVCFFFFFPVLAQTTHKTPFLQDTPEAFVITNDKATLRLDKKTLKVSVLSRDGEVQFSDYQSPAFLVNEEWVLPEGAVVFEELLQQSAIFSVVG